MNVDASEQDVESIMQQARERQPVVETRDGKLMMEMDISAIEVPSCVAAIITRDWLEQGETFEEFLVGGYFSEVAYDLLGKYDGELVEKDLAIFLRDFVLSSIPSDGGYPVDNQMEFTAGRTRYTILAFGWQNGDNNEPLYMVGYKEIVR